MGLLSESSADLPLVTVIVLSYNSRRHLETCFRSLLALRYPAERLELMLVDNASADGSLQFIAARFPKVTIVNNPDNCGFARGNNEGARRARGQLVAFLNPDMRVEPNWLTELVASLQRDPSVVCAASKILSWNGQHMDFAGSGANFLGYGYQEGWGEPSTNQSWANEKLILAPCGGAMVINRQVFLDSGGFDEDYFAFYEDLDLGWRLWLMGYQVAYVPHAVAYHIHHGSWDQVPNAKMSVLYQRNAMSTLVKNYDDENLARILPVALLLYLRRTYLAAEADISPFRSEPPAVAPHVYAETPHPATGLEASPTTSVTAPQVYDSAYYLGETLRTLRQGGLVQLWRKMTAEMQRRWSRRRRVKLLPSYQIRPRPRPEHTFVTDQAIGHLIAADDLARSWGHLMEKRQAVQSRRRRSDQEVLAVFGRSLASDSPNPHYMRTMSDLAAACGLHNLFELERNGRRDEACVDRQR